MTITENLAEFSAHERGILIELLMAWKKDGLPNYFYEEEVRPCFNKNSGYVFLTNSEFQVAMINPESERLEEFYSTPYSGSEGFLSDLIEEYDTLSDEDKEFIDDLRKRGE